MAFFGGQAGSNIKRLVVLAALAPVWSGCAELSEIPVMQPQGHVASSAYPVPTQAVESAPPVTAPPEDIPPPQPAEPSKPATAPQAQDRPPLKEALQAAKRASGPEKQPQKYIVQPGDTLTKIAKRHQVTIAMLQSANQLKTDRINAGQALIIPSSGLRIEIDKSENNLRLFYRDQLVRSYPVATGDQGVTPVGTYTIANRLIQPTWYWQGYAVTPDDPDYPLGTRWLGLSRRGYGIHGTNEPDSIGKQASHGCIRMFNKDVEELFDAVAVGTPVKIVD